MPRSSFSITGTFRKHKKLLAMLWLLSLLLLILSTTNSSPDILKVNLKEPVNTNEQKPVNMEVNYAIENAQVKKELEKVDEKHNVENQDVEYVEKNHDAEENQEVANVMENHEVEIVGRNQNLEENQDVEYVEKNHNIGKNHELKNANGNQALPNEGSHELPPIRGPGDSNWLPFEDESSTRLSHMPQDLENEPQDSRNTTFKKILFWNDAYGVKHFGIGFGHEPFVKGGCRINTCSATGDRERYPLEEVDAVVWHLRAKDKSLPMKRSPHTRYVFWMMESASNTFTDITRYNNVFNWTFTYRRDSDFPNPYGIAYRSRKPLPLPDFRNITASKSKLVAWFVSNCYTISGRGKFVENLQKWINVDIYGQCGTLRCDREDHWDVCLKMLEKDYKFYLSFENSLCRDYVTEKFYTILARNVIPVVYGSGNYSEIAPPNSFINARDFPSAKALAQYLLYLDKNETAYNEYFQWKAYHYISKFWARVMKPWCELCERLHNDHKEKYYNLGKWFVQDSQCLTSSEPEIYKLILG